MKAIILTILLGLSVLLGPSAVSAHPSHGGGFSEQWCGSCDD